MTQEYKGYEITSNIYSNKIIKPIGKGSVASELRGLYTSTATARLAIDALLEKQDKATSGVTKNATAKDSGRAK